MTNYERYPNNIFKPTTIDINGKEFDIYKASFKSLYDLYKYLKSEPEINKEVFNTLASESGNVNFAGVPYAEALENLISSETTGYDDFIKLNTQFESAKKIPVHIYETLKTQAGGHLNIQAYSVGNPLCYETEIKVLKPKFIRMFVTLSYSCNTTEKQVINRAIIIASIVSALEKFGYKVDLNTFSLDEASNEIEFINVKIKNYGQKISMQSLYKVLCNISFLRRILFRVIETLDLDSSWQYGYGKACNEETIRNVLKLNKDDILITSAFNLGIKGDDILEDFNNAIENLGLSNIISIKKEKQLERKL